MILLISIELDISTDEVIDWLSYFGADYTRINREDITKTFLVAVNNKETSFKLCIKNKTINSDAIDSFWYRKHGIGISSNKNYIVKTNNIKKFLKLINDENSILETFIESILAKKHGVGYVKNKYINKLKVLQSAKECGLLIPDTIITTNKSFIKSKSYIIKAVSEGIFFRNFNLKYMTYTKQVYPDLLPNSFNPTLFQNMIEKEFELRIFYLKGKCYSMAIFSQNDKKTKVDFRNYNNERPNRTVPYIIPDSLKNKIISLMDKLEFNTGSVDFIVDKAGKYYFLEVNPSGQFGMVSKPCNYFLEKEIAQELMNYEK